MTDCATFINLFSVNYFQLQLRANQITDYNDEAGDILHDTFFRLQLRALNNKLPDFENTDHFIRYMYWVIRANWRRLLHKKRMFTEFVDLPVFTQYTEQELSEEHLLESIQKIDNPRHKQVLLMLNEGKSHQEIQIKFGLSEVNTRSVIFEARRKIYEVVFKEKYKAGFAKRPDAIKSNGLKVSGFPQKETMVNKILYLNSLGIEKPAMWATIKENDISSPKFRTFHSSFHYLKNKQKIA